MLPRAPLTIDPLAFSLSEQAVVTATLNRVKDQMLARAGALVMTLHDMRRVSSTAPETYSLLRHRKHPSHDRRQIVIGKTDCGSRLLVLFTVELGEGTNPDKLAEYHTGHRTYSTSSDDMAAFVSHAMDYFLSDLLPSNCQRT